MLLRNLNPPKLCNGTRIQITSLHDHLIRGKILSGQYKGQDATIPRIPIIPTGYPFQFKRIQFPVKLSFVMTINKSQRQSIKHCGLYLENPCFSHGQFMLEHHESVLKRILKYLLLKTRLSTLFIMKSWEIYKIGKPCFYWESAISLGCCVI